jgi:Uma2 family endonuclease
MSTAVTPITAEQLLDMGDIGRCELVRGEIVRIPLAEFEHGDIAGELFYLVKQFVSTRKLGKVYAAETGFIIARNPDTVRAADVAFVRKDSVPSSPVRGFFPQAPDLAIEVISPSDRLSEVAAKVEEWLAAGTTSVWVVDPHNHGLSGRPADSAVPCGRGIAR